MSAPSAVSATSKTLRYGTQKAAGSSLALADAECRKRGVLGKATLPDAAGFDFPCLPATAISRLQDPHAAVAMVARRRAGSGRIETRGARAPPLNFA